MRAMARAAHNLGITSDDSIESMNKAMKEGRLISEEVLPEFSKELWIAANQGGALEEAMNNTGSALGRFQTNLWMANKQFNESGFDKGIRNLVNSVSDFLVASEGLTEFFGFALGGLANRFRVIFEVFQTLGFWSTKFSDWIEKNTSQTFGLSEAMMVLSGALALINKRMALLFAWFYIIPWAMSRAASAFRMENWGSIESSLGNLLAIAISLVSTFALLRKVSGGLKWMEGAFKGGKHSDKTPKEKTRTSATGGDVDSPSKDKGDKGKRGWWKSIKDALKSQKGVKIRRGGLAGAALIGLSMLRSDDDKARPVDLFSGEKSEREKLFSEAMPAAMKVKQGLEGFKEDVADIIQARGLTKPPSLGDEELPFGSPEEMMQRRLDSQTQQNIIQGGITINVDGAEDPKTVSESVLETIQNVFREAAALDPVNEK